ncbi:polysaccharide pyruvyl transferase family protein [Ancylobacter sp. Lp-2]|uniref:polysaccharide pyruvyl transferase family protein n=1 Tax=Ancylobacter sp. Lp-2 TaxID=2881339 RepID=UPI001E388334|nr:polysaccharide pyruvyl transferase family protein [Ancylobacter sp. Lp-2]MCB4768481.1 polysaccharide pyruvyl transferase family protein [Ancylobacter sp. Lp-2]
MSGSDLVLISGMFDMNNYGDLLFPLVAGHRLAQAGYRVAPVAPAGGRANFVDALPSFDIATMLSGDIDPAGIVIGGGYIVHANSLAFLDHYIGEEAGNWSGLGLWLGATLAAALRDIPLAWNAPGVPHPFSSRQRTVIAAALRAASYVAVRDEGSARLLAAPADVEVALVPDPIADLPRLWPKAGLAAPYRELLARKDLAPETRLLAVHVRNRSIAGLDRRDFADALRAFADAQGLVPMLVAVGQSHDDPAVARELAGHLGDRCLLLDDPPSLREITAAFAHSALYVGASLHGYIVASTYGVPGVLVGRPSYNKFPGFLAHTGRGQDLARSWDEAWRLAAGRQGETGSFVPASVAVALDQHWARLVAALAVRSERGPQRRAFALELMRSAVATEGPGWALAPLLTRRMRAEPAGGGDPFGI